VLRPFNYCVIDEVDSILIDEARTPLIISGDPNASSDQMDCKHGAIPIARREALFLPRPAEPRPELSSFCACYPLPACRPICGWRSME